MSMRKGQLAPRKRSQGLREKAWWVLKAKKSMTIPEIMAVVCTGEEKDPEVNLQRWLTHLVAAGVLDRRKEDDGKLTSNGTYRYIVIRTITPKPPVVRFKKMEVYDPNTEITYPITGKIGRQK